MQKWGVGLLLGATALLAGCSGSGITSGTSNPTQTGSTLTVSTTALPSGTVGTAYSAAVVASGGATPYAYTANNLPSGLSISPSTVATYRARILAKLQLTMDTELTAYALKNNLVD